MSLNRPPGLEVERSCQHTPHRSRRLTPPPQPPPPQLPPNLDAHRRSRRLSANDAGTIARCALIAERFCNACSGFASATTPGSVSIARTALCQRIADDKQIQSSARRGVHSSASRNRVTTSGTRFYSGRETAKTMKRFLSAAACTFVLTIATAHAQPPPPYGYPRMEPPPPPSEVIPSIPPAHPNWAWRGGYYRWYGGRYMWVPGSYIRPPHVGYRWYPGHWRQTARGWAWMEGRWR